MDEVDETIEMICEWIQAELKESNSIQENNSLPEMIKALAELVSARRICSISESDLLEKLGTSLEKQMVEELQELNREFRY